MKYVMPLKKALAKATEDSEGLLTPYGMAVAHRYAQAWVTRGLRDLELEREHPELAGLFWDIRVDPELARAHAV
jgi:hypothetical protein